MRIREALALNKGYTLIEAVLVLSGLTLLLSLSPLVINVITDSPEKNTLDSQEVELFFMQAGQDIRDSVGLSEDGKTLYLEKPNGDSVSYESYEEIIRRQVNRKGHEVLLQNVDTVNFEILNGAVKMTVGKKGVNYERVFALVAKNK
jgi:competence protein ComGF